MTIQGKIATYLHEVHCLTFSRLLGIQNRELRNLQPKQLVAVFSCFTNITVSEDLRSIQPLSEDEKVKTILSEINKMYQDYQKIECEKMLDTGTNYDCHYDLLGYVEKWCDCANVEDCKFLLQTMAKEKEIFLGEFVKALLKINNISAEMEKVAELIGDIDFLSNLRQIPSLTLKYVVTNQSLYL